MPRTSVRGRGERPIAIAAKVTSMTEPVSQPRLHLEGRSSGVLKAHSHTGETARALLSFSTGRRLRHCPWDALCIAT
jgi:hypothetical protein